MDSSVAAPPMTATMPVVMATCFMVTSSACARLEQARRSGNGCRSSSQAAQTMSKPATPMFSAIHHPPNKGATGSLSSRRDYSFLT
jgi:hypothetical protein